MTTEIHRQPGIPASEYPRHREAVLAQAPSLERADLTPTKPKFGHSFSVPAYRLARGLTVRPSWNWLGLLWAVACLAIGAAFALAF